MSDQAGLPLIGTGRYVRFSPDGKQFLTRFSPASTHADIPLIALLLAVLVSLPCSLRFRPIETKSSPNQGMRTTGKNALVLGGAWSL